MRRGLPFLGFTVLAFGVIFWRGDALAQDNRVATNLADLAQQAFSGVHSIYLPFMPWNWQAYSLDGGEPLWVDCSQLPCTDLFPVCTNLQVHGVQLASVVLTKNVLTGEVTLQPNGATDIVARVGAPSDYQPGALSEDRGVWRLWQQWTNCPDCWGEPEAGILPPLVTFEGLLLADSNDYATYEDNAGAANSAT